MYAVVHIINNKTDEIDIKAVGYYKTASKAQQIIDELKDRYQDATNIFKFVAIPSPEQFSRIYQV